MNNNTHKIFTRLYQGAKNYKGDKDTKIYVLINNAQRELLKKFLEVNDHKYLEDEVNIMARIKKAQPSFVLSYNVKGRSKLISLAKILYPDPEESVKKTFWNHDKVMINRPNFHPFYEGVKPMDTIHFPPEGGGLVYDFRPENVLAKAAEGTTGETIGENLTGDPTGGALSHPEIGHQPGEGEFYCAFHHGVTSIKNRAVQNRCKDCQYKWKMLEEAGQTARRQGVSFNLTFTPNFSDYEKMSESDQEFYRDSHMYNPKPIENIYQAAPTHCYITGNKLVYNKDGKGFRASLIRKDPKKGYTLENSIIVARSVSLVNRGYSLEETIDFFHNQIKKIDEVRELQPRSYEELTKVHKEKLNHLIQAALEGDRKKYGQNYLTHTSRSLFEEVLKTDYVCSITGSSLHITTGSFNMISIDKIDFEGFHTNDNIHIVSWGANMLRGDILTPDEAREFIEKTYKSLRDIRSIRCPSKDS